jgi:hypothetical protein
MALFMDKQRLCRIKGSDKIEYKYSGLQDYGVDLIKAGDKNMTDFPPEPDCLLSGFQECCKILKK